MLGAERVELSLEIAVRGLHARFLFLSGERSR